MSRLATFVRRLAEAQGYLELGLPRCALDVLDHIAPPTELEYQYCLLRGEALREAMEYDEAARALERAAQLQPEEPHVYFSLAWCYKRSGHLPRAIDAMRKVQHIRPRDPLAHYNLACYLSLAGHVPEAIARLGRALALDPSMREQVPAESDFDPIRHHPDFLEMLTRSVQSPPSSLPPDVA